MRWFVVNQFSHALTNSQINPTEIAIVGGSSQDPEVKLVRLRYPEAQVIFLGIDNYGNEARWLELDLNARKKIDNKYQLVVCSQVLEHIWNMKNALHNLAQLVQQNGYLWLNCPASNIAHGSPDYFSAGYTPEYLSANLNEYGFNSRIVGNIGSERYYKTTHLFRHWATEIEHDKPVFGYRISKPITLGKIKEMLFRLPSRLIMKTWSKHLSDDLNFATETYYFGQKTQEDL